MIEEFRRGKQPTTITSLSFDEESKYLICASIKESVHIFKVPAKQGEDAGNTKSYFSMLSSIISIAGDEWSFA